MSPFLNLSILARRFYVSTYGSAFLATSGHLIGRTRAVLGTRIDSRSGAAAGVRESVFPPITRGFAFAANALPRPAAYEWLAAFQAAARFRFGAVVLGLRFLVIAGPRHVDACFYGCRRQHDVGRRAADCAKPSPCLIVVNIVSAFDLARVAIGSRARSVEYYGTGIECPPGDIKSYHRGYSGYVKQRS